MFVAMVHMDTRSTGVCCNDIHGHTEHKCLLQWYIWTHGTQVLKDCGQGERKRMRMGDGEDKNMYLTQLTCYSILGTIGKQWRDDR